MMKYWVRFEVNFNFLYIYLVYINIMFVMYEDNLGFISYVIFYYVWIIYK